MSNATRVPIAADRLELLAYHTGRHIEIDGDTAYLRIDPYLYVAQLDPATTTRDPCD